MLNETQLVVPKVHEMHTRAASALATESALEQAEGGAGAEESATKLLERKEAFKAALLALWHWIHLVFAPGAVASLPSGVLAVNGGGEELVEREEGTDREVAGLGVSTLTAAAVAAAKGSLPRFPADAPFLTVSFMPLSCL